MMTRSTDVRLAAPACPQHGDRLDGGPVLYWCPVTGHDVPAADIDNEFKPLPAYNANALVIAGFAYALSFSWLNAMYHLVVK